MNQGSLLKKISFILQWIRKSFSAVSKEREEAENHLKAEKDKPDYLTVLLKIMLDNKVEEKLRSNAAKRFAEHIKNNWEMDQEQSHSFAINRLMLKNDILKCLDGPKSIYSYCIEVIIFIAQDFPKGWPELSTKIAEMLKADDYDHIQRCLELLYKLLEKNHQSNGTDIHGVKAMFAKSLPNLLQKMVYVIQWKWDSEGNLSRNFKSLLLTCKIYFRFNFQEFLSQQKNEIHLQAWMKNFQETLKFWNPTDDVLLSEEAANLLVEIKTQVCANLTLSIKNGNIDNGYYMERSVQSINSLFIFKNKSITSNNFILNVLKLLKEAFTNEFCRNIFQNDWSYKELCKKMLVSNSQPEVSAETSVNRPLGKMRKRLKVDTNCKLNLMKLKRDLVRALKDNNRDEAAKYYLVLNEIIANFESEHKDDYCHIKNLPSEMICHILINCQISITDVVNFGATCQQFRKFSRLNDETKMLCQTKYIQRLPTLWKTLKCERDWMMQNTNVLFEKAKEIKSQLSDVLRTLTTTSFKDSKLNPKLNVVKNYLKDKIGIVRLCITIDELLHILNDEKLGFTTKYYANILLRYLREEWVIFEYGILLQNVKQTKEENPSFEGAAVLVAAWLQPEQINMIARVSYKLDKIANEVKKQLRKTNPKNANFSFENTGVVSKLKRFNFYETTKILDCICIVLFKQLRFRKSKEFNYDSYKTLNLTESICVNKVLETRKGALVILLVIFESVARRFGLQCSAYTTVNENSDSAILLRLKYISSTTKNVHYCTIDITNVRVTISDHRPKEDKRISIKKMMEIMASSANIPNIPCCFNQNDNSKKKVVEDSLKRLSLIINEVAPHDGKSQCHVWHREFYPNFNAFHPQKYQLVKRYKYPIGLILRYQKGTRTSDRCPNQYCERRIKKYATYCVVAGYSGTGKPMDKSYFILCDGGLDLRAEEEHLHPIKKGEATSIDHPSIGRYFSSFAEFGYTLNSELKKEYSCNDKATNDYLRNIEKKV